MRDRGQSAGRPVSAAAIASRSVATRTSSMPGRFHRFRVFATAGVARHDRPGEAEALRLAQASVEAGDRAQLAGQAYLAAVDGSRDQGPVAQGGGEGEREGQVDGRFLDGESADDAGVDVVAGQVQPGAPAENGDQQGEALRVEPGGGAPGRAVDLRARRAPGPRPAAAGCPRAWPQPRRPARRASRSR